MSCEQCKEIKKATMRQRNGSPESNGLKWVANK